ncbi:TetR/AcrR family transcriptional regulator [Gordonia sp. VNK21]|uniref:TetR/AcrR family transcriptional regulator n=1 Tax=Gordonia sp. VNK21 TaxID=3382483 RepID=UPI0038D43598
MARTAGFDRDAVVESARTLFWRVGYDGCSILDLEAATGLSRSSLYNTFGSKRGLFDAAVQSYLDQVIRPRLAPLQAATVADDAIVTYLTGLRAAFHTTESMPATSGCLLVNTASSPLAEDRDVARVIGDYRRELQQALTRGIAAHRPQLARADAERLGETVTGLLIAAFAIARVEPARAADSVTTALELLDG